VAGWQQSAGVSSPDLLVDTSGTALVAFTQSAGSDGPNLYFTSAAAGGKAGAACAPMPVVTGSAAPLFTLDAEGSGRILAVRNMPATAALAK
jgi:hypothetical protein